MSGRVLLRAAALAVVVVGVIFGLTAYFSSESVPPCLASGTATWRPPTGENEPHRFAVVFADQAACFFAIDDNHRLVGQLRLDGADGITAAVPNGENVAVRAASGPYTIDLHSGHVTKGGLAPFDNGTLTQVDAARHVMYVTQPGLLGFRVIDMRSGRTTQVVHYKGFTWNRRFGPNPPSHGLVLRPDRPELWVLDAPNRTLHVFDVSEAPRKLADVRLAATLTTPGSLTESADGRYLYVGGTGDVIDTQTRMSIGTLAALEHANAVLEVDWIGAHPLYPGFPR